MLEDGLGGPRQRGGAMGGGGEMAGSILVAATRGFGVQAAQAEHAGIVALRQLLESGVGGVSLAVQMRGLCPQHDGQRIVLEVAAGLRRGATRRAGVARADRDQAPRQGGITFLPAPLAGGELDEGRQPEHEAEQAPEEDGRQGDGGDQQRGRRVDDGPVPGHGDMAGILNEQHPAIGQRREDDEIGEDTDHGRSERRETRDGALGVTIS